MPLTQFVEAAAREIAERRWLPQEGRVMLPPGFDWVGPHGSPAFSSAQTEKALPRHRSEEGSESPAQSEGPP